MLNLEIKDLTFHYRKSHYTVFKDFNLTLSPGHIYGLLGANGTPRLAGDRLDRHTQRG